MGGTQLEQESWLEPYIPPVPSAFQQPPSGGYGVNAGRMQQSCGNKAMRCKNHKVLNCTYGMCGTCYTRAARQPSCNIARRYKNNKHTWTSLIKNGFEQDSHQQKHPLKWVKRDEQRVNLLTLQNMGEIVPFLLKVGEIWHFQPLIFPSCGSQRTYSSRFTHLHISPTCRFGFDLLNFPVSPTCRFYQFVNFIFIHLFFPFHPLADFTYL